MLLNVPYLLYKTYRGQSRILCIESYNRDI